MKSNKDFYFHAFVDGMSNFVNVCVTPKAFFDENGYMWDGHLTCSDYSDFPDDENPTLGLQMPDNWGEVMEGVFEGEMPSTIEETNKIFRDAGFSENEKFSDCIRFAYGGEDIEKED